MVRVIELNIYPIKSCAGISCSSAVVEKRGLAGDRRYMLVDAGGRFLTQREHPRMALIRIALRGDGLLVEAPGCLPLSLPAALADDEECRVSIWRDELNATLAAPAINDWFSAFMSFPCRLVYMDASRRRPLLAGRGGPGDEVSFADGAPLLLISQASLGELNGRLRQPVQMNRFRPNIVVGADRAFAEEEWFSLKAGEAELEVGWPCSRCVLTTVDPQTGVKDPHGEPLATLRSYRRTAKGVIFGVNLIPRREGLVRVGDPVEIVQGLGA